MVKLKLLTIIIFFININFILSQDLIILKNNIDTIKCKIIEDNISNLKYRTLNSNDTIIYQINQSEIDSYILVDKIQNLSTNYDINYTNTKKDQKYHNITEVGYMKSFGRIYLGSYPIRNDVNALTINTINGFQFTSIIYLGLGLGVDIWSIGSSKYICFLDSRINFNKSSFVFFDTGLAFNSGAYINCGLGIIAVETFILSLSYKYQQFNSEYIVPGWSNYSHYSVVSKNNASFINIKLGFIL